MKKEIVEVTVKARIEYTDEATRTQLINNLRRELTEESIRLPTRGRYAVGKCETISARVKRH